MEHASLLQHYLQVAQPFINQYGYTAIFVGILLEDFGLPVPGETLLVAGALVASQGRLSIVWLALLAWLGAVLGDNIGYAIGRFGGRRLVLGYGRYVGVRAAHLERVEHFFERFGGPIVVLARFFAVLRQLNGIVAGIGGMPWPQFFAYNMIGAALWVAAWGVGVYALGHSLERVLAHIKGVEPFAIALGLVTLAAVALYIWRRRNG